MTALSLISHNKIDVIIVPSPFAAERVHRVVEAGSSIAGIIRDIQPNKSLARYAHVYLNEEYVPVQRWEHVRPKAGTVLSIRLVPMGGGGGGKNPLRAVLSLAVMVAVPQLTASLGGLFGQATFMGFDIGRGLIGGVNLLGRLALNALAPPPKPRFGGNIKESPTLFIQGARNQALPFARVPKVLGKHRFVPPLGALPYTETIGNDQYIRMLFIWGYGPLEIADLKIGETPLSEFDGVEIETRQGYSDDAPITLYSNSVLQNDLQINMTAAAGYVTRTTDTDADEISVDITLPRGLLTFNNSGDKTTASVRMDVQYSPKGLNQWSAGSESYKAVASQAVEGIAVPAAYVYGGNSFLVRRIDRIVLDPASGAASLLRGVPFREGVDGGTPAAPDIPAGCLSIARIERRSGDPDIIPSGRITDERSSEYTGYIFESAGDFLTVPDVTADKVTIAAGGLKFYAVDLIAKQSAAIRKSVSFKVPKGQYDVRIKRLTADSTDDRTFNETAWTALRTVRYTKPVAMTGLAMTALRIKATDQLNGVIERFNGVVHSILPDWNGSVWIEQVTSNPASIFRHILQGNANARPLADSRLDISKIETWHDNCVTAGREFNAIIDYDASVREVLQDVAATGRANPTLIDGKWAVVEDKLQTVPVQHFTPRNTYNFKGEKAFEEKPDALRVRFINRDKGWLQDERLVFDDGFTLSTATKYETLELVGVTSADQAWKDGRYHIATARLRPETYSFYADIEHIVCTRGDLIRFTHDVPLFGLMSARVKAVTINSGLVTAITLDANVPMEEGKTYVVRIRKSDGNSFIQSVLTNPGSGQILTVAVPYAADLGPATGDLALFGESGRESVELIVKSVEPQSNLSAKITCIDAAPAIHGADLGALPAFSSNITPPPELQRPPAPVLSQIQSGLESMIRHADGSLTSRIVITLKPPACNLPLSTNALICACDETELRPAEVIMQSADRISITDIAEGETYDIQLRYLTDEGAYSAPLMIAGHRVEGTTALPSDVAQLNMNVLGNTAYLSWSPVVDVDLDCYALRYAPQTSDVTWGSATDLILRIPRDTTSVSVPAAVGTYLLKAVDIGGRLSANAVSVVSTIAGLAGFNAVLDITEGDEFAGAKTDVGVSDGMLFLTGADDIEDWDDVDAVINADIGNDGIVSTGIYAFAQDVDLGSVYTSRLTADLNVFGIDTSNNVDLRFSIDSQEAWDEDVDPSLFNVLLQLRTTNDNPAGSPVWSGWMPFVVGDYSARAYQFRAVLGSRVPTLTPAVSRLRVNVDMPDRTVGERMITADIGGSAVLFNRPFKATPAISITAQNMATGDYYAITDTSASGFTVQFFNAGSTGISRTFDYLAKGYGEQI